MRGSAHASCWGENRSTKHPRSLQTAANQQPRWTLGKYLFRGLAPLTLPFLRTSKLSLTEPLILDGSFQLNPDTDPHADTRLRIFK